MSEKIQFDYITAAIAKNLLPADAHRMPHIISLTASRDASTPIQFWQLYSVLGQDPIVTIVQDFYERVLQTKTGLGRFSRGLGVLVITLTRRPRCGSMSWVEGHIITMRSFG
jgi:hypothetical protein